MCAQGRPDETLYGIRIYAGEVSDAYLQRVGIQRGYTVSIWRGRHVAEPTELAPEEYLEPVKLKYDLLGNSIPHLHTHVMPRFADDPRPGWPFPFPEDDPPPHPLDELRRDATALRELLA